MRNRYPLHPCLHGQLDDVPVHEEPGQEVLHLPCVPRPSHVEHEDAGLGLGREGGGGGHMAAQGRAGWKGEE